MYFYYKYCKVLLLLLCMMLCNVLQPALSQKTEANSYDTNTTSFTTLSEEATQLLKQINFGTLDYNSKLKSGMIKFSLNLEQMENIQRSLEKKGVWNITYRFDGKREFYDIKIRKKMELNGAPLPNWQETHLQYQIEGKKLYVRQKNRTGWKKYSPQTVPSPFFKPEFNPFWWNWPIWNLTLAQLNSGYQFVDIQQVQWENTPHYHLTLKRRVDTHESKNTLEIWLDPQKGFQPTQMLAHRRYVQKPFQPHKEEPASVQSEKMYSLVRYTYQLAQLKPNIWFPKLVTMEKSGEMLEVDKKPQSLPIFRKITMQVDKVVFNIPIDEKDLRFPD